MKIEAVLVIRMREMKIVDNAVVRTDRWQVLPPTSVGVGQFLNLYDDGQEMMKIELKARWLEVIREEIEDADDK